MIYAAIENIRRHRDSGAGIDLAGISMLEWKLLLLLDWLIEAHERSLRMYAKAMFEALAAKGI